MRQFKLVINEETARGGAVSSQPVNPSVAV